ncbi:MAG: hypothetical protein IJW12_00950, partial [Opitutales bacterium]|nr:hypothetical protein [Opitutales bacterium]
MELFYEGKKTERAIRAITPVAELYGFDISKNTLILGDNLPVLRAFSENPNVRGKIDLIYIDPPFSTNTDFTFSKTRVSTISSKKTDTLAYSDRRTGADFIEFLRERLIFARDLLSPKG